MPKVVDNDPRVDKAARHYILDGKWGLPYHMRGCGFSQKESKDRTLQMRVRRRSEELRPNDNSQQEPPPLPALPPASTDQQLAASTTINANTPPQNAAVNILGPTTKPKKTRKTAAAAQQERVNKRLRKEKEKNARKEATRVMAVELKKKEDGEAFLSFEDIIKNVETQYGVAPSKSSVYRDIRAGRAGMSPPKVGGNYKLEDDIFKLLCSAITSAVQINQINADEVNNRRNTLARKIADVLGHETPAKHLLERILAETATNLIAAKGNVQEHRRILWCTHYNLSIWFDTWEFNLLDLGFAFTNAKGAVEIFTEQLKNVLNLDESSVGTDGTVDLQGGRQPSVLLDPSLPSSGTGASKSNTTSTFIGGSNAIGEPLPPHFQFPTAAKSDETMKINIEAARFTHTVRCKFGMSEERDMPCTFGCNTKGGMDDKEFAEFIRNSIRVLYPFVKDEPGSRVIIKCDSGVGRNWIWLLAECRAHGIYIYPSE